MKSVLPATASALIAECRKLPQEEHAAAADAALMILRKNGCTAKDLRRFCTIVAKRLQEEENVLPVTIVSPSGNAEAKLQGILRVLENILGQSVLLSERADHSLIGGFQVAFGDERIDASLRGALARAKASLAQSHSSSF